MKHTLRRIILLALAIIIAFSFVGCYGGDFLSESKVNKLGNKLGLAKDSDGNFVNPTATIVLNYTYNSNNFLMEIKYELLFDKAPITVNNFIALVNDEFYKNTLVDTVNSAYSIMGRYKLNEDSKYELQKQKFAIKGEFEANSWFVNGEDATENAKHQLGCLGMYHAKHSETVNYFDTASTAFYAVWTQSFGSSDEFSNGNYAVFAYVVGSRLKIVRQEGQLPDGYYPENGEFTEKLDSGFVNYITNADYSSKTDLDGTSLSNAPTEDITITSITLEGVSGQADTRLRKKA